MSDPWNRNTGPLMNENGDWFAFPPNQSRRAVSRELVRENGNWLLDDITYVGADDECHISLDGWRGLLQAIQPGWLRPFDPATDIERGEPDWFFECNEDDERRVTEAWIVKL